MRTSYDIEMMRQIGTCSGIENYSRHIDGRAAGQRRRTACSTTSRRTSCWSSTSRTSRVPQIGGMYEGDMSRKRTLVDHGFRLPSAMDNRPLQFEEFVERIGQTVYLSATPGNYELAKSDGFVEQLIRPTGLVDPRGDRQADPGPDRRPDGRDPVAHRATNERVLVTTLTKKMAEDLTDYLLENGIRTRYLHSEVDTLQRIELLRELRMGEFDVLVGINLLREGLDLPEVSPGGDPRRRQGRLPAQRDGLIQTIGRAARNVSGEVHMYADTITDSMAAAIDETNRRREKQVAYNTRTTASIRSRCARRSPTSPTCWPARTPTPTTCCGGRQDARPGAPVRRLARRATAAQARSWPGCRPATSPTWSSS